jgi:hypothetical protein
MVILADKYASDAEEEDASNNFHYVFPLSLFYRNYYGSIRSTKRKCNNSCLCADINSKAKGTFT